MTCEDELQKAIDAENKVTDDSAKCEEDAKQANKAEQRKFGGLFEGTLGVMALELSVLEVAAIAGTLGEMQEVENLIATEWKRTAAGVGFVGAGVVGVVEGVGDWVSGDSAADYWNKKLADDYKQLGKDIDARDDAWDDWCQCMEEAND